MRRFAFHGLVDVFVDAQLNERMQQAVEFQLGARSADPTRPEAPRRITVRPYDAAPPLDDKSRLLYESFGELGSMINMPEVGLAVAKTDTGFDVYCDDMPVNVTIVMQLLLVEQGVSFVHAAALQTPDGRTTLLPGAKNVGKTAIIGEGIDKHGFKMLGDDLVGLSSGGMCYSLPRAFALKEYHRSIYPEIFESQKIPVPVAPRGWPRIKRNLKAAFYENAPFRGLVKWLLAGSVWHDRVGWAVVPDVPINYTPVPIEHLFGSDSIVDQCQLDEVVYLDRHRGSELRWESVDADELADRMTAIIHREWSLRFDQITEMSVMRLFDFGDYISQVRSIMRQAVAGVPIRRMLIPQGMTPADLVCAYLDRPTEATT